MLSDCFNVHENLGIDQTWVLEFFKTCGLLKINLEASESPDDAESDEDGRQDETLTGVSVLQVIFFVFVLKDEMHLCLRRNFCAQEGLHNV